MDYKTGEIDYHWLLNEIMEPNASHSNYDAAHRNDVMNTEVMIASWQFTAIDGILKAI